jgi:hypothetical protein
VEFINGNYGPGVMLWSVFFGAGFFLVVQNPNPESPPRDGRPVISSLVMQSLGASFAPSSPEMGLHLISNCQSVAGS